MSIRAPVVRRCFAGSHRVKTKAMNNTCSILSFSVSQQNQAKSEHDVFAAGIMSAPPIKRDESWAQDALCKQTDLPWELGKPDWRLLHFFHYFLFQPFEHRREALLFHIHTAKHLEFLGNRPLTQPQKTVSKHTRYTVSTVLIRVCGTTLSTDKICVKLIFCFIF